MTAVFTRNEHGQWIPSEQAQGPFLGLQGGAVAGLLAAQIEAMTRTEGLGTVVGVDVGFYRATPLEPLHTSVTTLHAGRRTAFVEGLLLRQDGKVCACARATLVRTMAMPGLPPGTGAPQAASEPELVSTGERRAAPHGRPWFMDTMRAGIAADGTAWFDVEVPVVAGAGAISRVLGVADWCHGIHRPVELGRGVAADPNPDLSVRLVRAPQGRWLGVRASTLWRDNGLGVGFGTLCDVHGDIGSVAMSVALVPGIAAAG